MSCHKTFTPAIGQIALSKKYAQRVSEYEANPKKCEHCQKGIPYDDHKRKKFCSHSCAAIFNNLKREYKNDGKHKRNKEHEGKVFKNTVCANCGLVIKSRKYCSRACQTEYLMQETISRWLNGEIITYEEKLPQAVRFFMLAENNYQCSQCKWGEINPITGNSPIAIDHIDGNPTNHSYENLRVLCPNCHSLTPNYGSLNKGNGRKKRYKAKSA